MEFVFCLTKVIHLLSWILLRHKKNTSNLVEENREYVNKLKWPQTQVNELKLCSYCVDGMNWEPVADAYSCSPDSYIFFTIQMNMPNITRMITFVQRLYAVPLFVLLSTWLVSDADRPFASFSFRFLISLSFSSFSWISVTKSGKSSLQRH